MVAMFCRCEKFSISRVVSNLYIVYIEQILRKKTSNNFLKSPPKIDANQEFFIWPCISAIVKTIFYKHFYFVFSGA